MMNRSQHDVRLEMYERIGQAAGPFGRKAIEPNSDWRGKHFGNPKLSGTSALVGGDTKSDFNWGTGAPAAKPPSADFSVRWTRKVDLVARESRSSLNVGEVVRENAFA